MELTNKEINDILTDFPDLIAKAESDWKTAKVERERIEALAYFRLKAECAGAKVTEAWLANKVLVDDDVHRAKLDEIVKEAEHSRLYEKLMCAKKIAQLRTAF